MGEGELPAPPQDKDLQRVRIIGTVIGAVLILLVVLPILFDKI